MPHTPPLQANGRSGRTRWAPSRIGVPAGTVDGAAAPVEQHGHLGARARGRLGVGGLGGRLVLDVEQLAMDAAARDAELAQHPDRVFDHAERAAQPPVVRCGHVDGDRQQRAQLAGVEPAVEQLHFLRFAAEHVDQADPLRVGVLEVGDLVGEHHRIVAPVAVEQGDGGLVLRGEHGSGDGQDGGDPAARGDQDVVRGGVQIGGERARRRLHVDHVAGPDLVHQPAGHRAACHLPHADARRAPGGRADRVGPPFVAAADGHRLPGREGEPVRQPGRHVEGHRGRVVGQRVDPRHGERVERGPAGGGGTIRFPSRIRRARGRPRSGTAPCTRSRRRPRSASCRGSRTAGTRPARGAR